MQFHLNDHVAYLIYVQKRCVALFVSLVSLVRHVYEFVKFVESCSHVHVAVKLVIEQSLYIYLYSY